MATEITGKVKLDFYALGNLENKTINVDRYNSNQAVKDKANNLLERNSLSLKSSNLENIRNNYRQLHTLKESNIDSNNYLNPFTNYNSREKYQIKGDMTNIGTYQLAKEKLFAQDRLISNIPSGVKVNKNEFLNKKNLVTSGSQSLSNTVNNFTNNEKVEKISNNNLYFDKNNTNMIRYPKGFWSYNSDKMNRTKISDSSPEWFHLITDKKQKEWNDAFSKKEESLSVFSRFQKWITVTPKNKDRRKPLEKIKSHKMEETSKIMPNWMQIKIKKEDLKKDQFRSVEFDSNITGKKTMILVDKQFNKKKENDKIEGRSVFSIGDYKHNTITKDHADFNQSNISHHPKEFLHWNDGKVYDPKFKKDVYPHQMSKSNKNILLGKSH